MLERAHESSWGQHLQTQWNRIMVVAGPLHKGPEAPADVVYRIKVGRRDDQQMQQHQSAVPLSHGAKEDTQVERGTRHKLAESKEGARVITSLLSGGMAGACAKTVIAPLERVKIMFQVSHQPFSVKEAFRTVGRLYQREGLFALWKGNTATMVRIIPFAAIQFMSHEQYSAMLSTDGKMSPPARFISGALAGATATTFTYPLDLMRARLAVHAHDGLLEGLRSMMRQGITVFYRGLRPTLAGIVPYAGTSFFTYEMLSGMVKQRYDQKDVTVVQRLMCGATAGLVGQSISYPLDIVRRRMQTDGHGQERKYFTIAQTMRHVVRHEGWRGMYKGLSLNWIKGPVAVAISFTTYDIVSKSLRDRL